MQLLRFMLHRFFFSSLLSFTRSWVSVRRRRKKVSSLSSPLAVFVANNNNFVCFLLTGSEGVHSARASHREEGRKPRRTGKRVLGGVLFFLFFSLSRLSVALGASKVDIRISNRGTIYSEVQHTTHTHTHTRTRARAREHKRTKKQTEEEGKKRKSINTCTPRRLHRRNSPPLVELLLLMRVVVVTESTGEGFNDIIVVRERQKRDRTRTPSLQTTKRTTVITDSSPKPDARERIENLPSIPRKS